MLMASGARKRPYTQAVRKILENSNNSDKEADLLFLEAWEMQPTNLLAATLRASQIRRANPELAAAINAELKRQS
jgi:hypothetical protein